jgi:hypothetical protein
MKKELEKEIIFFQMYFFSNEHVIALLRSHGHSKPHIVKNQTAVREEFLEITIMSPEETSSFSAAFP